MKKIFTLLSFLIAGEFAIAQFNVGTYSGTGTSGLVNGPIGTAQFNWPYGVVINSGGDLYVADAANNVIRKISASGTVSTFAGSGAMGSTDGTAATATFNNPKGLDFDASGNLIVAEYGGHKIRKIDPSGNVTTLAGSGPGLQDGSATTAKFYGPSEVKVAANGDVYVADYENHCIRIVNGTTGAVTTYAGNGTPGAQDGSLSVATLYRPRDLDFDSQGNLFFTDLMNHKVRMITPGGMVSTFAGSGSAGGTDATGTAASFNAPTGLVIDSFDNIYVTDGQGHRIRKINSSGVVTTIAGTGVAGFQDGTPSSAQFDLMQDICIDASNAFLYIGDRNNHRIRTFQIGKPSSINENANNIVAPKLFPNPTNQDFTIDLSSFENSATVKLDLYTANGALVITRQLQGGQMIQINTEGQLSSGMYLVSVTTNSHHSVQQLVVE